MVVNHEWFREAAPFINCFRGKTFVFFLSGDIIAHKNFNKLLFDIAILHTLGVRLVIVHGARPQIDLVLARQGIRSGITDNLRITDDQTLDAVKQTAAAIRLDIEAGLSMGLINTPMFGAKMRIVTGNFITARPLGVKNGIDYIHTGLVRKIDAEGINIELKHGSCVLLSAIGFSPSGQIFNLNAEDAAMETAAALQADKYVIIDTDAKVYDRFDKQIFELAASEIEGFEFTGKAERNIKSAASACAGGVKKCHILSGETDGVIFQEFFTVTGVGLLISAAPYEKITPAKYADIPEILKIIKPLEQEDVLVKRDRMQLESEIDNFQLLVRGEKIIGVAAFYPYLEDNIGEIACIAVHPDYRGGGRGDVLLEYVEKIAARFKLNRLFVLSTQSAHWFIERGFVQDDVDSLPVERKKLYNFKRNSRVFVKKIQ